MSKPNRTPTTPPAPAIRTRVMVAAIAGFVVIAGVVAVAVSRNDRSGSDRAAAVAGGSTLSPDAAGEIRPVRVAGPALERQKAGTDPAVGTAAPVLTGSTFTGDATDTTPVAGRRRLLVFLAHWCPHCRREVPRLVKWAAAGGVPDDVDVTAIATATAIDRDNYPPSAWLAREKLPFPVLVDDAAGTAASSFGLNGFPFLVLVNADGTVAARASGEKELDELSAFAAAG